MVHRRPARQQDAEFCYRASLVNLFVAFCPTKAVQSHVA